MVREGGVKKALFAADRSSYRPSQHPESTILTVYRPVTYLSRNINYKSLQYFVISFFVVIKRYYYHY